MARLAAVLFVAVCALLPQDGLSVDKHKFRTCAQTGFCRRHRHKVPQTQYTITHVGGMDKKTHGPLSAVLHGGAVPLTLELSFLGSGICRTRVTDPAKPRWEVPDVIEPIAVASRRVLAAGDPKAPAGVAISDKVLAVAFGPEEGSVLVLTYAPLKLELYVGGSLSLSANSRSLFHFEHHRSKDGVTAAATAAKAAEEKTEPDKKIIDYDEHGRAIYEDGSTSEDEHEAPAEAAAVVADAGDCDACWEESFSSHTDSKPLGPASVGMDINFHGASHVYGIPEHATQMALKPTTGGTGKYDEPYRLYTLDVFEYDLDVPMSLYVRRARTNPHAAFVSCPSDRFQPTHRESWFFSG